MALPPKPKLEQFETEEEFEEALGFWNSRVGRIQSMVARTSEGSSALGKPRTSAMKKQRKESVRLILPEDGPHKVDWSEISRKQRARTEGKSSI